MSQPLEVWTLHPYPFDIGVPPGSEQSSKFKQRHEEDLYKHKKAPIHSCGDLLQHIE